MLGSSTPLRLGSFLLIALLALGICPRTRSESQTTQPRPSTSPMARSAVGTVVAVGGGGTPRPVLVEMVRRAKGSKTTTPIFVVVLPQASRRENAGQTSCEMWLEAGAEEAVVVSFDERSNAKKQLERAQIIWMSGGSQSRLLTALDNANLTDVIRERHQAGIMVGGTSAGAAILSEFMMTGKADLESIRRDTTELVPGLGLCPDVVIDQHFHKRRRFNRLFSAVLDRPRLCGVGIDERTAVFFTPGKIEVFGESSALILDARRANVRPRQPDAASHSVRDAVLHLIPAGESYPSSPPPKREPRSKPG